MENVNPLGEEKISKLLIKFSVLAVVGMMINALYNIVDRIYIGNAKDDLSRENWPVFTYLLARESVALHSLVIRL